MIGLVASGARCRVARRMSQPLDLHLDGPGAHVVVGPNGAGKTTWLAVLSGRLALRSGDVRVGGRPLAEARSRGDVLVVDTNRSPASSLAFSTWAAARGPLVGVTPESFAAAVGEWEIAGYVGEPAHTMSTGMRARCLLALAFASTSAIVALDEPERGLDALAQELLRAEMDRSAASGRLVVIASHDATTVARARSVQRIDWMQR